MSEFYILNLPHVVHDTIDGETIIVNLKNGNYYSFDKAGVSIWTLILEGGDFAFLRQIMHTAANWEEKEIQDWLDPFLAQLIKEGLILKQTQLPDDAPVPDENVYISLVQSWTDVIDVPVLHRYENLQDMLFLDPIHDTNEQGWPSGIID